jgi:hypothetical protein
MLIYTRIRYTPSIRICDYLEIVKLGNSGHAFLDVQWWQETLAFSKGHIGSRSCMLSSQNGHSQSLPLSSLEIRRRSVAPLRSLQRHREPQEASICGSLPCGGDAAFSSLVALKIDASTHVWQAVLKESRQSRALS